MARVHILLAAVATVALATPAAAQSAGDGGLRYLSWPGQGARTAPASADAYGLRGAEPQVTLAGGAPAVRRPDRYSGGGDSLQARYYERRQAQSAAYAEPRPEQPRYEQPAYEQPRPEARPEPRYEEPRYEAAASTYEPPRRLAPPPVQPQPDYRPQPQPEPRQAPYEPQQPAQTIQIQPPAGGYAQRPQSQPPVQQQAQTQPEAQPTSGPAASGDGVRYYSVHRGAGRQPDPIPQTYVDAQDAMVALAPPTGTSLAERQRQATAEDNALNMIRQLPPDQLALLLDVPQ